jgi:phosphatidylserine/phosphatidylglycerophosphate/cardiolipin synthase-like enzyme
MALSGAAWMAACGGGDESSGSVGSGGTQGSIDAGPDGQSGTGGAAGMGGSGGTAGDAGQDAPPLPPDATAVLEIYPMDVWAQFLPAQDYDIEVSEAGSALSYGGSPVLTVPLAEAKSLTIALSAPEHRSLEVAVEFDGSGTLAGATLFKGGEAVDQGVSFSHEMRDIDGKTLPVHSLYLGLRHLWFSAQGRPARRGNDIELLMDGEEAWGSVYEDLSVSSSNVMLSTWWWSSWFELVRDPANHHTLDPAARWENTILGVFEATPARKRVLVGQFWGQDSVLDWVNVDDELIDHADDPNDDIEFMGMANETEGVFMFAPAPFTFGDRVRGEHPETGSRDFESELDIKSNVPARQVDLTEWPVSIEVQHASYHQKFVVIDDALAYVGGMNFQGIDWDGSGHEVFDHRRLPFDATQAEREEVMNKEALPDTVPRKDYMVRIQGPAAQDVADVFQIRWEHQLSEGVAFAENSTSFEVERDIPAAGDHQIQVTATLPQPFWEHAIAETWFNAVAMAEDFIFIEDQYFRMPMVNEAIKERMTAVPGLRLIVITIPVNEWTDPGCPWTYKSHELFRSNFPDRYMMLQLRAFDTVETWGFDETESRYQGISIHSKMLIVDDKFMSIGSCNKNNRGLVYEGELNVAVLDPVWVREERRRILANMLPAGTPPTDDLATWWDQFEQAAAWNDQVYDNWDQEGFDIDLDGAPLPAEYTPEGFVHTYEPGPVEDCFLESVGPDMTGYEEP